jgi:hypothetical protein
VDFTKDLNAFGFGHAL